MCNRPVDIISSYFYERK